MLSLMLFVGCMLSLMLFVGCMLSPFLFLGLNNSWTLNIQLIPKSLRLDRYLDIKNENGFIMTLEIL